MQLPPRLCNNSLSAACCSCWRPTCKCIACQSLLPCSHQHLTPAPPPSSRNGQYFPGTTTRWSSHGVTTSVNTELPPRLIASPSPRAIITNHRAGATRDLRSSCYIFGSRDGLSHTSFVQCRSIEVAQVCCSGCGLQQHRRKVEDHSSEVGLLCTRGPQAER